MAIHIIIIQIIIVYQLVHQILNQKKYDYVDSKLPLQPCLDESAKDKYYYYDNKNKLYDTYNFFEIVNSHKCSYCSGKYVYNNYCVNKCPLDAPYFVKIPNTF